jgi:hypothetical protein
VLPPIFSALGVHKLRPSTIEKPTFVPRAGIAHEGVYVRRKVRTGIGRLQGRSKRIWVRIETNTPSGADAVVFWDTAAMKDRARLFATHREGKYFWAIEDLTAVEVVPGLEGSAHIVGLRSKENATLDFANDEEAGHTAEELCAEWVAAVNAVRTQMAAAKKERRRRQRRGLGPKLTAAEVAATANPPPPALSRAAAARRASELWKGSEPWAPPPASATTPTPVPPPVPLPVPIPVRPAALVDCSPRLEVDAVRIVARAFSLQNAGDPSAPPPALRSGFLSESGRLARSLAATSEAKAAAAATAGVESEVSDAQMRALRDALAGVPLAVAVATLHGDAAGSGALSATVAVDAFVARLATLTRGAADEDTARFVFSALALAQTCAAQNGSAVATTLARHTTAAAFFNICSKAETEAVTHCVFGAFACAAAGGGGAAAAAGGGELSKAQIAAFLRVVYAIELGLRAPFTHARLVEADDEAATLADATGAEMFDQMDKDHSGSVAPAEFTQWLSPRIAAVSAAQVDALRAAFGRLTLSGAIGALFAGVATGAELSPRRFVERATRALSDAHGAALGDALEDAALFLFSAMALAQAHCDEAATFSVARPTAVAALCTYCSRDHADVAALVFSSFDVDHNGSMEFGEVAKFLRILFAVEFGMRPPYTHNALVAADATAQRMGRAMAKHMCVMRTMEQRMLPAAAARCASPLARRSRHSPAAPPPTRPQVRSDRSRPQRSDRRARVRTLAQQRRRRRGARRSGRRRRAAAH